MILAIVKQQLRQIRNISRFRFAIAGLLSIITKYKNNLKSRAHKECMAKIGRYVERALDRLTVTTMKLCRDSAPAAFGEKTRFGGSFLCFGPRRFRCNRETRFTFPGPCSWAVSQMIEWFTLPLDGQSCGLPIAVREAHVACNVGGCRRSRLGGGRKHYNIKHSTTFRRYAPPPGVICDVHLRALL